MSTSSVQACFTIVEAAQFLRTSRPLLIRQGRIKTVKISARASVRGAELDRILDQQQAVYAAP